MDRLLETPATTLGGWIRAALIATLLTLCPSLIRAAPVDHAVMLTVTVQQSPPAITLAWPAAAGATQYQIHRRGFGTTSWGAVVATLAGSAVSWTDTAVTVGQRYEYEVEATATTYGVGYQLSAIAYPVVDDRGIVLLIVDQSIAGALSVELQRLVADLVGDSWTVIRHDVSRTASVTSVKALITADYAAAPSRVRSVLLFGHVPVPYSGSGAPDGHPDHVGAWPTDGYYADMNGTYTDTTINYSAASRSENWNVPGDGKFDQYSLSGSVMLEVGRVDLSNMPSFALDETALLRQYLDKDHAFRTKAFTAQPRGLVDDNFGEFSGEAFAQNGWRNFGELVGPANVTALDWFSTLAGNDYLLAYGCGGGWYTSCSGVGDTSNFAATPTRAVFTILFGSYFGDWDSQDNFLRAPLANSGYGLTCFWGGRPNWFMHPMGLGEPVGVCPKMDMGSYGYTGAYAGDHLGLMGDPTLRLHVVAQPGVVTATPSPGSVHLAWSASADATLGYHVYRASTGSFSRITTVPISATSYDDSAAVGTWVYLVKAVKLETTTSGSYINTSIGSWAQATVSASGTGTATASATGSGTGSAAATEGGSPTTSCGIGSALSLVLASLIRGLRLRRNRRVIG